LKTFAIFATLLLASFAVAQENDFERSRVEVSADELPRFLDPAFREQVNAAVRAQGYTFVAVDLEPFRTGRMNDSLRLPTLGSALHAS
jgi:uncharacterized protein